MGDSEDEYDRKRRDKFRGERSEYRGGDSTTSTTIRRQPPSSGHDWNDRGGNDWGGRGGYRGRSGSSNDYHHHRGGRIVPFDLNNSPPHNKRPRTDWNAGDRFSHQDNFSISSGYSSSHNNKDRDHESSAGGGSTGPQLLSFKNWLSTQDDTISDQEALSKYAEYKQDFKKQKLNEFFMNHRNEEWFRNKFHPDDSVKRKEEQLQNLKKRVSIFLEFLNSSKFDEVTLDSNNSDKIVKLMDWFVIRMEDGTDEDAAQLLSTTPIAMSGSSSTSILMPEDRIKNSNKTATIIEGKKRKSTAEDGEEDDDNDNDADHKDDDEDKSLKKKKTSDNEEDDEDDEGKDTDKLEGEGELEEDGENETKKNKGKGKKRTLSNSSNLSDNAEEMKKVKKLDEDAGEDSEMKDNGNEEKPDIKEEDDTDDKIQITINSSTEKKEKEAPAVPLLEPLHRTASIFIRNLAPTITKQEVESLCKKYPGFLRVALADPQPERKWMRRGWVTFKRNVNIKEICWNLNNLRLRDTELQPIVNKDLTRRVRTVNGITPHKMIVRNDIRLAAKLIQHLDTKMNLWVDEKSEESKKNGNSEYSYGVYSANPVLKNITDYLIEEASAEEEELLGISGDQDDNDEANDKNFIERDEELIRVLDRLLYYLRFVHSVDYYNHSEYPYEDEMPNRLGISHGRGLPPASKVNLTELQEYNRSFEAKILTFIQPEIYLNEEECKSLGQKDVDVEVEKFITSNTQELGKDKWLCPLSGKKFKGPEFVRKHILNKHGEKLEEVQKEVAFFNFYLRDPKRPEATSVTGGGGNTSSSGQQSSGDHARPPPGAYDRYPPGGRDPARSPSYNPYEYPYGGPYGGGYYPPPMMMGGPPPRYGGYPPRDFPPPYGGNRGLRSAPFRSGGRDHRAMISYRDLDAPPEPDDY